MSSNRSSQKEQQDLTGNESEGSMDSFVREMPSNRPDIEESRSSPSPEKAGDGVQSSNNSYFSPSSSSLSERERKKIQQPRKENAETPIVQETIDRPRKLSSDRESGSVPPIAPAHPFFSPSYFDESDISDGSIVFQTSSDLGNSSIQQSPSQPPPHRPSKDQRDRFPSFDSVGSSSSIRYVPPGSRPPAAQPPAPVPKILPYHERRKRQRQQEQQQQQQMHRQPPRPEMGQPLPPFMIPPHQPHMQHPDMQFYQPHPGMGYHQSPYGMPPSPPQYGHFPMHPQQAAAMGMYPPQPPPYGQPPPPPPPPVRHGPYQGRGKPMDRPPSSKPSNRPPGYPQQPPLPAALPPSGAQRPAGNPNVVGTSSLSRAHSSSFDSSDDVPPRPDRRRKDVPPPPPPPPPLPPAHVRQDSSGSVSSLGSLERSGKEDEEDTAQKRKKKNMSGGGGFFQNLNPWSPKEPNVKDYHRKNQDFLRKASSQRQSLFNSPSPTETNRKLLKVGAMDRPPASRGTHKRLPSIEDDNWEEENGAPDSKPPRRSRRYRDEDDSSSYVPSSDSDDSDDERESGRVVRPYDEVEANERTHLLPPPGISTAERQHGHRQGNRTRARREGGSRDMFSSETTYAVDNTTATALLEHQLQQKRRKKKKQKRRSRKTRRKSSDESSDEVSVSSSSVSSQEYSRWMKKRARMLEKERTKLIKQWREEAKAEEEAARQNREHNMWHRRLGRYMDAEFGSFMDGAFKFFTWAEAFIGNLPLTIGAIALAIANLGVDWFKFAEVNMDSCEPVHFHSSQCTFPEFPGCFYCDTNAKMYKIALNFHWGCSTFAGILALTFIAKLIFARRVVFDELSSPTTATPAGLLCMTLDVVFAGRGLIGQMIVSLSSCIHLCLAIWFIYMALAYHIMPEPSWFPNTVSIGISAVKTWLYYPMAGHFLMAISLSLNLFFFPISLIRVAINKKISATVGWMQMSAPNVSLYALTLMAQPSFLEEHPDINRFQKMHRVVYLPIMHFFFGLCVLGMLASAHSLLVRWKDFRRLPFSPAHAAFCVPTLSHANAIQAYRAAVNSFSDLPAGHWFKGCLYVYWVTVLIGGTIVTVCISTKFLACLPAWTHIDTEGEIEPPAPYETAMTSSNLISTGETLVQPFVSPAILQANETGTLVLSRNDRGDQVYKRTRKVTALGFEPIMSELQMDIERELLLDWVGKHPPRRRHRTLSVPGIDFSYGANLGTGNSGVFGMEEGDLRASRRTRSNTSSGTSPAFASSSRRSFDY